VLPKSHRTTAAVFQYEINENITLPTIMTRAAFFIPLGAEPEDE